MSDLLNRIGIIKVSTDLLRENPEGLLEIFKDVLVTDVKIHSNGVLCYRGLSKHFDLVKEGEETPNYVAEIKHGNGINKFNRFIRVKKQ
jgi:hypothetical protein